MFHHLVLLEVPSVQGLTLKFDNNHLFNLFQTFNQTKSQSSPTFVFLFFLLFWDLTEYCYLFCSPELMMKLMMSFQKRPRIL
jgi:hypothetical protein